MLLLPDSDVPIRGIGFDPGTTYTGVSISNFSRNPYHMDVIHGVTLRLDKLAKMGDAYPDISKMYRMLELQQRLKLLYWTWLPSFGFSEAPYLDHFPGTFAALTECVTLMRNTLYECDRGLKLELIDPMTVKKYVGASGREARKNKNIVRECLKKKLPGLTISIDLDKLDEHAIDSIAVQYSGFRQLTGL